MIERSFELMEKKINDLIGVVDALKNEKASLEEEVSRMQVETNELNKKIFDMTRERDDVKDKVERIVARLEAIEL